MLVNVYTCSKIELNWAVAQILGRSDVYLTQQQTELGLIDALVYDVEDEGINFTEDFDLFVDTKQVFDLMTDKGISLLRRTEPDRWVAQYRDWQITDTDPVRAVLTVLVRITLGVNFEVPDNLDKAAR